MVDRRRIVQQWRQGAAAVLVTLVRAQGSSYRRPGARLLVSGDSAYTGTISGGCLEAEVVRKASWMVRSGAAIERYSTLFDDTAEIPFGLGCGGVVDLLFEAVDTPECEALLQAMDASLAGAERSVVTWLPEDGKALARAVFDSAGTSLFASAGLDAAEIASIDPLLTESMDPSKSMFVEMLAPPQRLFVLGAGDDAKPVVTMASLLGWSVTVVDGRRQLARVERFPAAERVLAASSIAELGVQARDAVVLMTHSYEQDRSLLANLLSGDAIPGYIGVLGARHRSSLLVAEAAALIGRTVADCCDRLYAPVGLDLGGDGPEAIALAVVAEVQAWVHGKLDRSWRLTAADVAQQIARGGASQYLQAQCAVSDTDMASL